MPPPILRRCSGRVSPARSPPEWETSGGVQTPANIKAGDFATANVQKWEPSTWPAKTQGVGFTEAPRGALGHWVHITDGRIENYQCVVPTTWNGSPRDPKGQVGAYEASLMDTPLAKADEPLEILRAIHNSEQSACRYGDGRVLGES